MEGAAMKVASRIGAFSAILAFTILLADESRADGILFTGADVEEFNDVADRIGKFNTVGAANVGGVILNPDFNVNGMAVANGQLFTGTVGEPHTAAADAQTIRRVDFNGIQQSAPALPRPSDRRIQRGHGFRWREPLARAL